MCGKNLVVMFRRQISLGSADGNRLLRTHHDCVRETAYEHDQRKHEIHDADAFMIDRGQPFAPQIRPVSLRGDPYQQRQDNNGYDGHRPNDNRLVKRNRRPTELAEEIHRSALIDSR
jgi:hypothetical protein